MTRSKKSALGSAAASVVAIAIAFAVVTMPASAAGTSSTTIPKGTVYQANVPCCQNIVLPAWPAAGPILTSKVIPPGNYTVTANVFLVIGPSENDTCWVATSNSSDTISGSGGAVGNGASESGTGAGGVYANAVVTDTVVVTAANDHLIVNCDSKHPGQGTYAAGATLIATKVGSLVGI